MRQLQVVAAGALRWVEVPAPVIEHDTDVVVRPVAVTLCDLDRPMATGSFPLPLPIPFGHEFVAEVVEVGNGVHAFRSGDQVVVPFQISCGNCASCALGLTANCESVPDRSQFGFGVVGGPWGGGFSDLVRVPFADRMLLGVPAGVAPESLAAAGDNLVDGYRCTAPHLERRPGGRVLVLGGIGSVPLYAVMFAQALGAAGIDYVDGEPSRRAVAEQLGARTRAEAAALDADAYDLVVDGTLFDPHGLETAARALRRDGTIVGATIYLAPPPLPYVDLYMKGAHFHTGRVHARALGPAVIDLVAAGRVDPLVVTAGEVAAWDAAEDLLGAGTKPIYVAGNSGA